MPTDLRAVILRSAYPDEAAWERAIGQAVRAIQPTARVEVRQDRDVAAIYAVTIGRKPA